MEPPPNLFFDVEDLFEHAAVSARPSGIQRVTFEIYRALLDDAAVAGRVRFVRHDRLHHTLRSVAWSDVARLFAQLGGAPSAPSGQRRSTPERANGRVRRLADRLPPGLRQRLVRVVRLQCQAGLVLADLVVFLAKAMGQRLRRAGGLWREADGGDFAALVRPGDVLAVLGAPWVYLGYAGLVAEVQRIFDLRLVVLVHDLIPIMRSDWFPSVEVIRFRACLGLLLPSADVLLTVSQATAADAARFAAADGLALRAPMRVIPLGSGFAQHDNAPAPPETDAAALPPPGSYVLYISTLDARKNHQLLFRVWLRLLQEMQAEAVPMLVFAGRVGSLVADLMQQLENSDYLGGKIRLLDSLSDADLARLYRGCRFTLFPSLYEGWGLPVTESLAFGKPCLAARSSPLLEAGGRLVRYFDPESVSDAYAVIRATIEDAAGLRAWEAEVARAFVPTPWSATAAAILRAIDDAPSDPLPRTTTVSSCRS